MIDDNCPRSHRLWVIVGCLLFATLVGFRLSWAAGSCTPPQEQADAKFAAKIDAIVDAALEDGFAGGVALVHNGRLVYDRADGFSDHRGKVPVRSETLFHVASVSKYLTALATLRSAELGKLALEEQIARWVPGTRLAEREITWLDLLSHRSGLKSSYAAEGISDPNQALAAIDAQPIDVERVGEFRYSNDGYDLLAILLERVWERPFEDLVRELILQPSRLERPRFWAEVDLKDPKTVGQPLRRIPKNLRRRNYGMLGSAGLLVTALDLARLEVAVSRDGLLLPASLSVLRLSRGSMSLGEFALGSFLVTHPSLGLVFSMRGYEAWGDNAILNDYRDHGFVLAIVTSKGPAEKTGQPPFRSRISREIEECLVDRLEAHSSEKTEISLIRFVDVEQKNKAGGSDPSRQAVIDGWATRASRSARDPGSTGRPPVRDWPQRHRGR